jgi:Putative prokaryotic signal transducing protein
MEEQGEKIVVYQAYDTVMMANLAKTKLDAYGIPCFLTDEHFVNMYPIRNDLFPGVRLHIFENDTERVREILLEENP